MPLGNILRLLRIPPPELAPVAVSVAIPPLRALLRSAASMPVAVLTLDTDVLVLTRAPLLPRSGTTCLLSPASASALAVAAVPVAVLSLDADALVLTRAPVLSSSRTTGIPVFLGAGCLAYLFRTLRSVLSLNFRLLVTTDGCYGLQ